MDAAQVDWVGIIQSVGFPIFVAVWLLVKGSKDSRELKDAVNRLTTAIEVMTAERGRDT